MFSRMTWAIAWYTCDLVSRVRILNFPFGDTFSPTLRLAKYSEKLCTSSARMPCYCPALVVHCLAGSKVCVEDVSRLTLCSLTKSLSKRSRSIFSSIEPRNNFA